MADRYTRLYTLPENLYVAGAPLVIAAGALLKDNQTGKILAQLKYRSISDKTICAIKVVITGYDMAKDVVCRDEHQYLDLAVGRDGQWGSKEAIALSDRSARSYTAAVLAVYFDDGSSYMADGERWEPLPEQDPLDKKLWDGELAKQYKLDTTEKSAYVPMEQKDLWFCACGEINHPGERCRVCGQELGSLLYLLDVDRLREEKNERLRCEEERAAAIDAVRAAQQKKLRKTAMIAGPLTVVAAVAIVLALRSGSDSRAYASATALLESERYAEAATAFARLGDYRDSSEKAAEATDRERENAAYSKAVKLLNENKYEQAYEALTALGDYKDAPELADEAMYLRAKELLEEKDFNGAKTLFDELGTYKDSAEFAEGFVQRLTVKRFSRDDENGKPLTVEYAYDSRGVLAAETRSYPEDPELAEQTYEYTYNDMGGYTLTNKLVSRFYDKHGNYLGQSGLQLYQYEYGYYDSGAVQYCDAYTVEEEQFLWETQYDESGNEERHIEDSGEAFDYVNVYDDNGRLLRQYKYDSNGVQVGRVRCEYDETGRPTMKSIVDQQDSSKNTVIEYIYGYVYAPDAKAYEAELNAAGAKNDGTPEEETEDAEPAAEQPQGDGTPSDDSSGAQQ